MRQKKNGPRILETCCLASSLAADYMIHQRTAAMGILLLLSAAGFLLVFRSRKETGAWIYTAVFTLQAALAAGWMIMGSYPLFLPTQIITALGAVYTGIETILGGREKGMPALLLSILFALALLAGGIWNAADAISPQIYLRTFWGNNNSFSTAETRTQDIGGGITLISDIIYDTEYPNGTMDLYLSPRNGEAPLPTFLFIHGGGFMGGDKGDIDPFNPVSENGQKWYFQNLCEAGYNVVSLNYATTPDYCWPVPMVQTARAVQMLSEKSAEFGLDMRRVILSGSSAGGNIAGVFVLAQCDGEYAARTGIPLVISPKNIKAAVFVSALLDGREMASMGNIGSDYLLYEASRAYFQTNDYQRSAAANDANIIANAKENFPPSYISDGNDQSFGEQAHAMHARMREMGITAELTYFDGDDIRLSHGFELTMNEYAEENLRRTIAFLDRVIPGAE